MSFTITYFLGVQFLYSATMTNKVSKLERACLRNPVKIKVCYYNYCYCTVL